MDTITERHRAMKLSLPTIAICVITVIVLRWAWKMLNWLWLKPKKLEKLLRQQGFHANPYKFWVGDVKPFLKMQEEAKSKALTTLSHDLAPHVFTFINHTVNKYGKKTFMWFGPEPRLIIMDPEQVKDVLNRMYDFPKPENNPIINLIATGLPNYEGEKWAKHRKIINPAFNLEKMKIILPTFFHCCNDMVSKWEGMLSSSDGKCEIDVWPSLQNLTRDVISRAAFGSNYEEGRRIFELLREQSELLMKIIEDVHIPLRWLVPTRNNRRMKEIDREVKASLKVIIHNKVKGIEEGVARKEDLLGILLESNRKEIQEHGNKKNDLVGLTIQDIIEECKIFYIAGQETTSSLLVFTMVLLSRHPDWQARAREEVLQVFGNKKPDFDGLSRLKIVTMILNEVLRLYPPVIWLDRYIYKDMNLGNLSLPAGVRLCLPILLIHHDKEIWGDDSKEFNPNRFSEGVSNAAKFPVSFFPFGWGPRICIGQNFAMLEAKMALSMILQHFSFELSPTYTHALDVVITLQPQFGANVVLHKL